MLVILVAFYFIVRFPSTTIAVISGVSGWLLLLVQIMYKKWEWFYLLIQKIKVIFYPDTDWNLSIRYEVVNVDIDIFDVIDRQMLEKHQDKALKIQILDHSTHEYRMKGMTLRVYYNNPEEIELQILDMSVSYQKAVYTLNRIIDPLLTEISGILRPKSIRYYFQIEFDGARNPYYGLYIQRLSGRDVTHMEIIFNIYESEIELHKNSLTIKARSFGELMDLSKQYLLLSS